MTESMSYIPHWFQILKQKWNCLLGSFHQESSAGQTFWFKKKKGSLCIHVWMQSAKSWLLQHSFIPHQHFTCFIYFLYVLSVFIFLQPQGLKPARLLCLCFMLIFEYTVQFGSVQFSSVAHSCLTLIFNLYKNKFFL